MQKLTIHDIESCELKEIDKLYLDSGIVCYTRDLVIYDIKGNKTVIVLFSDERETLDVKSWKN